MKDFIEQKLWNAKFPSLDPDENDEAEKYQKLKKWMGSSFEKLFLSEGKDLEVCHFTFQIFFLYVRVSLNLIDIRNLHFLDEKWWLLCTSIIGYS